MTEGYTTDLAWPEHIGVAFQLRHRVNLLNLIAQTKDDGLTAAMPACWNGHLNVLEFLHNAYPDLIAETTDSEVTLSSIAELMNHEDVVEFLKGSLNR